MSTFTLVCLCIIGVPVILDLIGSLIYISSGGVKLKKIYHDIQENHLPDTTPRMFDGCSIHCSCKICGKEIMQDSQGNWF